jgi:hypothetical protein
MKMILLLKGDSLANTEEKSNNYVYKQTRDNGEYYVGIHSTEKVDDNYNGSGTVIKAKYKADPDSFTMEILYEFETRQEASDMEAVLVTEETIKEPLCLNLKPGGDNGWTATKETKAKMAASHTGKNNHNYDHTVYMIVKFYTIFLSKIFYGTQQEIRAAFPEMNRQGVGDMLLRKYKTHKGWMLPKTAMKPPANVKIHTIENSIHDEDSGTAQQLLEKHPEMTMSSLSKLLRGKLQTHKGWSLKKK